MDNEKNVYIQSPVFHVGEKAEIEKFCNDQNYLIYHEESGKWLGNGMYFWENMYDANYWYKNLKSKYPQEEYSCTKGSLKVEENLMLNLTNRGDVQNFEEELRHLCSLTKKEMKDSPGANINLYYKLYYEYFSMRPFTVAKVFGQYDSIPVDDLIYKHSKESARVVQNIRTIYSVLEADNVCARNEVTIGGD